MTTIRAWTWERWLDLMDLLQPHLPRQVMVYLYRRGSLLDDAWSATVMKVWRRRTSWGWHVVWLMMCGPPWREKSAMTRVDMLVWLVRTARKGPSFARDY